jgi:hypothetical protein
MREIESLSLLAQAAMPGAGLIAVGWAWLYWGKTVKALPATLLSLGIALLALMSFIVLVYSTYFASATEEFMLAVVAMAPLIYAVSLIGCVRRANISAAGAIVFGLPGLIPLWFLGGFVLINSICSFGTGGC